MSPSLTIQEVAARMFDEQFIERYQTARTYRTGLNAFERFLEETGRAFDLSSIDEDLLLQFYAWLAREGYGSFTIRTYLSAATALLRFAFNRGWLPSGFSLERARARLTEALSRFSYPRPRFDNRIPQLILYYDSIPLPEGEGQPALRHRLRLLRNRALMHTLYATAARISEIASLNRSDVEDGLKSEIYLRRGKGGTMRVLFLTDEAQRAIQAYCRARQDVSPALFISHGRGSSGRLSTVRLWQIVKHAARALGIEATPHHIRHYRATQLLNEGAPLEAVQAILGHADISTTQRIYASYALSQLRDIFHTYTRSPVDLSSEPANEEDPFA